MLARDRVTPAYIVYGKYLTSTQMLLVHVEKFQFTKGKIGPYY